MCCEPCDIRPCLALVMFVTAKSCSLLTVLPLVIQLHLSKLAGGNPNSVRTSQNDLPGALPIWKNPKSSRQSDKIIIQQVNSFKMWKSVIGI
jgi:hypothetical protein